MVAAVAIAIIRPRDPRGAANESQQDITRGIVPTTPLGVHRRKRYSVRGQMQ